MTAATIPLWLVAAIGLRFLALAPRMMPDTASDVAYCYFRARLTLSA